jgi:hypothetical protein
MPIPSPSTSILEDSTNIPHTYARTAYFLNLAASILTEHDITVPDQEILKVIVGAALEAQHAFFVVAIYEPTQIDLGVFLQYFILRCASATLIHTDTDNQTPCDYTDSEHVFGRRCSVSTLEIED